MARVKQKAYTQPISNYSFHPAVADWFDQSFDQPTPVQHQSWAAIASGKHTLLAAPISSGKTLTALMASIDRLIRKGLDRETGLPPGRYMHYHISL